METHTLVDDDAGHPRKPRARLLWAVAIAAVATAFAALVVSRMPRPDVVEPQREAADKKSVAGQPVKAPAIADGAAKQPEPTISLEPEPVFDFDAKRFSVELTLTEGAVLWPELFAPDAVPRPFAAAASREDLPDLTEAEWRRWLEPVDDEPADVSFDEQSSASIARLHGTVQLRCPWPRDGVLHFTPLDARFVKLLFWNGTQGTALVYHPLANGEWSAYRLERSADARGPSSIALVAIDRGQSPHAANGGFDIHHQGGQLIVTQHGQRLLAAPFNGPPQAVYISGDSGFRTIAMDRRMALPASASTDKLNVLTFETAPDLEWISLPAESDQAELAARFEKLALQSADRGDSRAFEKYAELLFTLPAWTNQPLDSLPLSLALAEIVPLVDSDRYQEVSRLCGILRFWNQPADRAAPWPESRLGFKRLVEWAELMSLAGKRGQPSPPAVPGTPAATPRHPWIIEQGRDALSPALGLATAIADRALDDACKFITETPLPTDAGLVPDSRDGHLAVSWPQTIRNALRDEPRLAAAMQARFGQLGELRLGRAIAESDAAAVRAASVQFLGTQITASALLELGDRELALGQFSQALATFQAALRAAVPEQAEPLEQRLQLAAGFVGMDFGRPVRGSVNLIGRELTAEQFETLVATQRRRAASARSRPSDQMTVLSGMGPPPGRYALRPVVSWEVAAAANDRQRAIAREPLQLATDGAGNIYATAGLGAVAVALQEGRVRWSHPLVTENSPREYGHRMASAGDRLFWSRPTAGGLELTCLDPATGAVKWHKLRSEFPVISDPIWTQRQLFVLAETTTTESIRQISLCELNPDSGSVISQSDFGGLISDDFVESHFSLTAIDDRLVVAGFAGVLCCDRSGHVHWLQRSAWYPTEIRELASGAPVETAVVVEPNAPLIVLQPGAVGLQAFDLETGRRVWQRAIPDLHRIVGATGGTIVALTPRGMLGYQAANGAFAWQHELTTAPFASAICNSGQVLTASIQHDKNGKPQLFLRWFDGRDGQSESAESVELPETPITSVATLGALGGRPFIFAYDREHSIARLLELVGTEIE